jgi:hypothetical protein
MSYRRTPLGQDGRNRAMDGEDLRDLPHSMRMTNLARLPGGRPTACSSHPSKGRGRVPCNCGLEGLVSSALIDAITAAVRRIEQRRKTGLSRL